jgi:hypothetical protein
LFGNPSGNEGNNSFRQPTQKNLPETRFFNQLLDVQAAGTGGGGRQDSAWNTDFNQPSQRKQSPEQVADMAAFRTMLEPVSPVKEEAATGFSAPPAPAPDPFLEAVPVVNPAGRSIPTLESTFARPAGIRPLPGISTPPPKPSAARPSWQAQLPPWMSTGPQPHNPGQNY